LNAFRGAVVRVAGKNKIRRLVEFPSAVELTNHSLRCRIRLQKEIELIPRIFPQKSSVAYRICFSCK
jgi:hypothetical protein